MGGDTLCCFSSEDGSSIDNECQEFEFSYHNPRLYRDYVVDDDDIDVDDDGSFSGSNGYVTKGFGEMRDWITSNPNVEFDGSLRRRKNAYKEIMKNFDELWARRKTLYQARRQILRYTPGSWVNTAGKKRSNYAIPKTTTLLLIGPKGSGKSSLINRISKVFEDNKFASERAQVTYNSSSGEGTYFLQEYMIPRNSTSFCLFDSRSLTENFAENDEMLQHWMTKGVHHGGLVLRYSDSSSLKMALEWKARQSGSPSSEIRKVNFVIFVVDGFSVLKAMNSNKIEERRYMETLIKTYRCPYLSFKDDKPVIVVTHGDLLSLGDRARVRVYLGEKLGVHPAKQIFDIPENSDPSTELTIIDMIRYSLEHADQNFPCQQFQEWIYKSIVSEYDVKYKVSGTSILTFFFLAILLGIACFAFPMHQYHKHDEPLLISSVNRHSKFQVDQHNEPREPLMAGHSNSQSISAVNHSHDNQESEQQEPHDTSMPAQPSKSVAAPSAPTSTAPTLSSKPVVQRPCEPRESRSVLSESRHPNSAVHWHKIRHLYLESD